MDRTEERLNGIRKKYMQHRRCEGFSDIDTARIEKRTVGSRMVRESSG